MIRASRTKFDITLRQILLGLGLVSVLVSLHLVWNLENLIDLQSQLPLLPHNNQGEQEWTGGDELEEWPLPFVHIINTRFMQQQAHLLNLAQARLVLFKTFCLRTVLGQTVLQTRSKIPPFLWIIKTDPDLDPSVLEKIISMTKPYSFAYIVGSNVNFGVGIHPGGWRGGEAGNDVLQSGTRIYTGDVTLLRRAHAARNDRIVLETRLDADDGLHVEYLETIQQEAMKSLRWLRNHTMQHQRWMYWCPLNRVDWMPSPPFVVNATNYGAFLLKRTSQVCITAGTTLGVSIGQEETSVPRFMHHKLYEELLLNEYHPDCGSSLCLRMVEEPELSVIRSRTPTSAGMKGVTRDEQDYAAFLQHAVPLSNKQFREALMESFHISPGQIIEANRYIQEHFEGIVADNLQGQCTHGHSCKNSTRDVLSSLLERSASHVQDDAG